MYNKVDMEYRFSFLFNNSLYIQSMLENNKLLNIKDVDQFLFSKDELRENKCYKKINSLLKKIDKNDDDIENIEIEKYINTTYIFLQLDEYLVNDNQNNNKLAILDLYNTFLQNKQNVFYNNVKRK